MPKPLRKIVHTMGWPLRTSPSFGEFGGSFIYPMGDDLVTVGFVAGLETTRRRVLRARRPAGVQDAPARLEDPRRRRAGRLGREDDHRGRLPLAAAQASTRPGLLLVGEGAGLVNVPRLKGVHYAIESGRLAAEAAFRALQRGEVVSRVGALDSYDESLRASSSWKELYEVRNMRQAFDKGFFVGGALASMMTVTKGRAPERPPPDASERGGAVEEDRSRRPAIRRRTARTSSTSSPRSSPRATARETTSRTT